MTAVRTMINLVVLLLTLVLASAQRGEKYILGQLNVQRGRADSRALGKSSMMSNAMIMQNNQMLSMSSNAPASPTPGLSSKPPKKAHAKKGPRAYSLIPMTDQTKDVLNATFVPGGLVDTIDAGSEFNHSTLENFTTYWEISGTLVVRKQGIVSLSNLAEDVSVFCDPDSRAIQVLFDFSVGADQLPYIFPLQSVLVINTEVFGPCLINPSTAPQNLAERSDRVTEVYMVIDKVQVIDDFTCVILGKTGTFFTMFSSGSLSIKQLAESRRSLAEDNVFIESMQPHDMDFEMTDSISEDNRNLQSCSPIPEIFNDIHYMNVAIDYKGVDGLDLLEAKWDKKGLSMTSTATFDATGTYEVFVDIMGGAVTPGRIDQTACAVSRRFSFLPMILGNFPVLGLYGLPEYYFNLVFEAPLHLDNSGSTQGEMEGFYYSSRLKYSTGRKSFFFSVKGRWDKLKVKVETISNEPGRFTASEFKTPPQFANDFFTEFPPKVYGDDSPAVMDFNLKAGITQNVVVYGSLFSAVLSSQIEMAFRSATPPNNGDSFAPDVADFDGSCGRCPKVKVIGLATVSKPTLDVALGHFVQTDLVGPSKKNKQKYLQVSVPLNTTIDPASEIVRSALCLYNEFGADSTLFCLDRCCDSDMDTCTFLSLSEGKCNSKS